MRQPEVEKRVVVSNGVQASAKFRLDTSAIAKVFRILRGSLYTVKPRALIREYYSNARDAHTVAGIGHVPTKLVLPTEIDPTLRIRDYGAGMSEEEVLTVYPSYGTSTKEEANDTIGFFGIGCKSAFCYTDTFTITSFHGGMRTVYAAVLDESDVGRVDKLYSEPCGDETGMEISIPVVPKDIPAFHREAAYLLSFADPVPDVNLPVTPRAFDPRNNGYVVAYDEAEPTQPSRWLAVMGTIPYTVDFSQMPEEVKEAGLDEVVGHVGGGLFFEIGEVSVAASREELEYTTRTKEAVIRRLRALLDELVGDLIRTLDSVDKPAWEKRMAVFRFQEAMKVSVPSKYAAWASEKVEVFSDAEVRDGDGNVVRVKPGPKSFRLQGIHYKRTDYYNPSKEISSRPEDTRYIEVSPRTRILVRDEPFVLKAHEVTVFDYLVVPNPKHTLEEVEAELDVFLEAASLTGIPVHDLSSVRKAERAPTARKGKHNAKHLVRRFVLRTDFSTSAPYSNNWDIVDDEPSPDDVFVILSHFQAIGDYGWNFYSEVKSDKSLLTYLGGTLPTIYGIKTTDRKPVSYQTVKGVPYPKWRKREFNRLLEAHPTILDDIERYRWAQVFHDVRNQYNWSMAKIHENLEKSLGHDHALPALFRRYLANRKWYDDKKQSERVVLDKLDKLDTRPDPAAAARRAVYDRYPLLCSENAGPDLWVLGHETRQAPWLAYIRLIDQVNP